MINRWENAILSGREVISLVLARAQLLNRIEGLRKDPQVAGYLPSVFLPEEMAEFQKQIERWNKIEKLFYNGKAGILAARVEGGDLTLYTWPGQKAEGLTGPVGLGWVVPLMVGAVLLAGCVVATTALIAWFRSKETDLKSRALEIDRIIASGPADVRMAYQDLKSSDGFRKDQGFLESLASKGSSLFGVLVALVAVAVMIDVRRLFRSSPRENPGPKIKGVWIDNPCGQPGYVVPPGKGGRKGGVYWSKDPVKRKRQAKHIQDWIDRQTTAAYIEYYRPGSRKPVQVVQEVPF